MSRNLPAPAQTVVEICGLGEYVVDFQYDAFNRVIVWLRLYFPEEVLSRLNFDDPQVILDRVRPFFSGIQSEPAFQYSRNIANTAGGLYVTLKR